MDLSVKYLGLNLKNPFVVGSCPLTDDLDVARRLEDAGAAALVLRSLFEEQIVAEELSHHAAIEPHMDASAEASTYFADVGAFTFGPDRYLEHVRKVKAAVSVPVIASLNGAHLERCLAYARRIEEAGADAMELNLYALATNPGVSGTDIETQTLVMVAAAKRALKIPVAVKLSPFYSSLPAFAKKLDDVGADGLVLFNRFYQPDIDIEQLEVDRTIHLSEPSDLRLRLRWLAILFGHLQGSLAVTGGVHSREDAIKAIMAGADVVQVVSVLLKKGPAALKAMVEGTSAWLDEHEYASLTQARGSMSLHRVPDPAAYERVNYAEVLKSWNKR